MVRPEKPKVAIARKPFAHGIGEAGQLDAARAHDADAAKLEPFGKVEDGLAIDQCRIARPRA